MAVMCRIAAAAAASAAVLTAAALSASAEGSVNLVGSYDNEDAYRPYLEWSYHTNMEQERTSVIYVYAEAGETIYFGSSANAQNVSSLQAIWGYDTEKDTYNVNETEFNDNLNDNLYGGDNAVGIAVTIPTEAGGMPYDPETAATAKYQVINEDNTINASSDSDTVYLFRVNKDTGTGHIASPAEEQNGPNVDNSNNDGYDPLNFTAPVTGTYAFRFLSANHHSDGPSPAKADEAWHNSDTNAVAAFDVTVYSNDADHTGAQTGRVWSDMLFLNTGSFGNRASMPGVYSNMYVLTDDGFEYKVDLNGIWTGGFVLYSNNRGFLWDPNNTYTNTPNSSTIYNLQSLNHSFYSADDTNVGELPVVNGGQAYINLVPMVDGVDKSHKLFFNKTENKEMLVAYTLTDKLVTTDDITGVKLAEENGVTYEGSGPYTLNSGDGALANNSLGAGTEGFGGTFEITVSVPEVQLPPDQMAVKLDFSGYALDEEGRIVRDTDGTWETTESPNDQEQANVRMLLGSKIDDSTLGENECKYRLVWNGLDAYGNIVPPGDYNIVSVHSANGVIHVPLIDVERNDNGIKIECLNDIDYDGLKTQNLIDSNKNQWTVYYNNTPSAQYMVNAESDEKLADEENHATGTSSENGAMIYKDGEGTQRYGAGDNTALDIWADCYIKVKENITITVIDQPAIQATVSFVSEDGEDNLEGSGYAGSHDTYFNNVNDALITDSGDKKTPTPNKDNGKAGGDEYGNTIATSFTARIANNGTSRNSIIWTVTIPNPTDDSPVFVKKLTTDEDIPLRSFFAFDDTAVLTDSESVDASHKGSIYKATGFTQDSGNADSVSFSAYDNISTTVTTTGGVIYGFVIDNLYAPGATATVTYGLDFDDSMADVSEDIHAYSYEDYSNKVNNTTGGVE